MTVKDIMTLLESPDRVRVIKDGEEIYNQYFANMEVDKDIVAQIGDAEVKRFRAIPEITHRKYKELGLVAPMKSEETPDYSFSDLQLCIYTLQGGRGDAPAPLRMATAGRQRFHVTGNKRITGGTGKMRIIAVMSPKGGIGKTTTSDAIAYMLGEEQEKRVLVLDGDPQGDTSKTFEAYEPEGTGMSELLERHVSVGGSYRI